MQYLVYERFVVLFIESTLNGFMFGLFHLVNLRVLDYGPVMCQVLFTTLMGFQLNIIQRYSNDLSLCWLIHFYHNAVAAITPPPLSITKYRGWSPPGVLFGP